MIVGKEPDGTLVTIGQTGHWRLVECLDFALV